jgi:hypothetical protein
VADDEKDTSKKSKQEQPEEKVESKADQVQPQRNTTLTEWPPKPTTGEE